MQRFIEFCILNKNYQNLIFYIIFKHKMDEGLQRRKLLLVVGKTGVGKSSFVAELVSQRGEDLDKSIQIKRSGGISSATDKCQIYQVHPAHQILQNQNLYIMDTPGLDSQDSACLITQMIDRIMMQNQQYRYEIVGIAYLITVNGGPRENNCLQKFLNVLKLKWSVKLSLIFCVISQWDVTELLKKIKKNQINKIINEWKNYLIDLGIGVCWEKLIKWSSTPVELEDRDSFYQYMVSPVGEANIKEQWIKLKTNLDLQYQFRECFEVYASEYKIFWQNISNITQKQFRSKQNIFQKIKLQNDGSINNFKTKTTKVSLGLLAGASLISSFIVEGIGKIFTAFLCSFFAVGTIVIDFPDVNIKEMKGLLKNKLQKKLYEEIVKRLVLEYIRNDLFKNAVCSPDGIQFEKCCTLCSLKVFQKLPPDDLKQVYYYNNNVQNDQKIPEVVIQNIGKKQEKTFEFQFDFKVPTFSRIVQIFKNQSQKIYGRPKIQQ